MVVPKLVTGPKNRAIEPNGQVMKPSGALVSELTDEGAVVAQTVVNCHPPVEDYASKAGGAQHSKCVFHKIQDHGMSSFSWRIASSYQRGGITELSISNQAPHQTFELSSEFISLVYFWGLLRRCYLLNYGQCNFWSSLHLDLLWRDIILLELNAVLKNFITTLPANRELGAIKNFREQQGLNFLILPDIISS